MFEKTVCTRVIHKVKDGLHVFTSKNLKGLFLVSKDFKKAHQELPDILSRILKDNHGIEVDAKDVFISIDH